MITRLKTILTEWSQELKDFFGRIRKHLSKHDKKIIRGREVLTIEKNSRELFNNIYFAFGE